MSADVAILDCRHCHRRLFEVSLLRLEEFKRETILKAVAGKLALHLAQQPMCLAQTVAMREPISLKVAEK